MTITTACVISTPQDVQIDTKTVSVSEKIKPWQNGIKRDGITSSMDFMSKSGRDLTGVSHLALSCPESFPSEYFDSCQNLISLINS